MEKVDVFSFGIVVLEVVSGWSNFKFCLCLEEVYFLDWVGLIILCEWSFVICCYGMLWYCFIYVFYNFCKCR